MFSMDWSIRNFAALGVSLGFTQMVTSKSLLLPGKRLLIFPQSSVVSSAPDMVNVA